MTLKDYEDMIQVLHYISSEYYFIAAYFVLTVLVFYYAIKYAIILFNKIKKKLK
jgi:hypothetical protein